MGTLSFWDGEENCLLFTHAVVTHPEGFRLVGATGLTIFGFISSTSLQPLGVCGREGSGEERLMEIAHTGGQRPCHITSETSQSSNCTPLVQVHTAWFDLRPDTQEREDGI